MLHVVRLASAAALCLAGATGAGAETGTPPSGEKIASGAFSCAEISAQSGGVRCHRDTPRAYTAIFLASRHIGSADLSDDTPGLTFGLRGDLTRRAPAALSGAEAEWHIEAGVFRNSYRETAPLALAGLSARVADLGPLGSLRLGASAGVARYRELSEDLSDRYGLPSVAGFIPIVAATLAYRHRAADVRLTTVPPGEGTTAIFNLSLAVAF